MRIALVSFEFPPAIAIGGIGTYAWEAATMLAKGGHQVEVFTAGSPSEEPAEDHGIKVFRFDTTDRSAFRQVILETFVKRHLADPFDVLESPELGMEAQEIAQRFPDLPLVVKLHTPSYLLAHLGWEKPGLLAQARFFLGCLTKGRFSLLTAPRFDPENDPECLWTRSAHEIASPSLAIGKRLVKDWSLEENKVSYFPLPFTPSDQLLSLEPAKTARTIGFLGRLEPRKGIIELTKAIPEILKKAPDLRFRLIGPSWNYQQTDMISWIRKTIPSCVSSIDFVGSINKSQLPAELSKCDVMLFPSRWESFGLVCPESMAAGRAVIGSSSGGMAEIMVDEVSGLLVPPKNPGAIVDAVLRLVSSPQLVNSLAKAGRQRVLDHLSHSAILPQQIASYQRAIDHLPQ